MLASPYHPHSTPQFHQREYLPKIPSPLSPRSANINGGRRQQNSIFSMTEEPAKPQPQSASVPFSKRAVKKAPVVSQDALKERRRGMFLKKVREGREDKRFQAHGEDIMRLDFVQRQKQWEAEQARLAPVLPSDTPEEDEEELQLPESSNNDAMQLSQFSTQWHASPEEAEEVARRESEELEALLSFLPGEDAGMSQPQMQYHDYQSYPTEQADEQMSEHFGSDEDDYDALFSDFINAEAHDTAQGDANSSSGDVMDMS